MTCRPSHGGPGVVAQEESPSNAVFERASPELDFALFRSPPPGISLREAKQVVRTLYGVEGTAKPLSSERDANFLVSAGDQTDVLKISNGAEAAEATDFQTDILLHLAQVAPKLAAPRVLPAGKVNCPRLTLENGSSHAVRLLTYIPGLSISEVEPQRRPLAQIGSFLAELDRSLATFPDTDFEHRVIWNSARLDRLESLIEHVTDAANRTAIERELDTFRSDIKPVLSTLRNQIIHNDINLNNLLLSEADVETIAGVYDFGDAVVAPLINEIAVAAAYHLDKSDPDLRAVTALLTAYHESNPLTKDEVDLLYHLILARVMTTMLVTSWRAALFPDNRTYILRHAAMAHAGFGFLTGMGPSRVTAGFLSACGYN